MALEASGLTFTYGKGSEFQQPALGGVDLTLDVSAGPLLIAGRTGSGKSTLLRVLAGLLAPDTGTVSIDGVGFDHPHAGAIGGVGLAFQSAETQLFEESVLSDVMFGPKNQGLSHAEAELRALEALLLVGLEPEEFSSRSPFTLSGGEARRVAIAGILALKPAFLLLDEPLAGLDAEGRDLMVGLIEELSGATAIAIVSHDIEELLPVCSGVLLLDGGRAAFSGSIDDLIANPAHLLDAGLELPGLLKVRAEAVARGIRMDGVSLEPEAIAGAILQSGGLQG